MLSAGAEWPVCTDLGSPGLSRVGFLQNHLVSRDLVYTASHPVIAQGSWLQTEHLKDSLMSWLCKHCQGWNTSLNLNPAPPLTAVYPLASYFSEAQLPLWELVCKSHNSWLTREKSFVRYVMRGQRCSWNTGALMEAFESPPLLFPLS